MRKSITLDFAVLFTAALLTSCTSVKEIGRLNLVSVRNIDPHGNYVLLQKNVEYTKRDFKKTRTTKLESAVDQSVKKVAGGEYLMNAKISLVEHSNFWWGSSIYYAVEGDVWGIPLNTAPTK